MNEVYTDLPLSLSLVSKRVSEKNGFIRYTTLSLNQVQLHWEL